MKINFKSKKLWWFLWILNLSFCVINGVLYVITSNLVVGVSSFISFLGMMAANNMLGTLEDKDAVS